MFVVIVKLLALYTYLCKLRCTVHRGNHKGASCTTNLYKLHLIIIKIVIFWGVILLTVLQKCNECYLP